MNKKEKDTLLNTYKSICYTNTILEFNNTDTKLEFEKLLDNLNMTSDRYKVENTIIAEKYGYSSTVVDMFNMIFNDFYKYGCYIKYYIEEIEIYFDDLRYKMNNEENKCNTARINYILNSI